jgi:hypothetical protein
VVEIKEKELEPDMDSDSNHNKGKQIVDAKPISTITTTTIQLEELQELGDGEHLFHSQMWVKGDPLHFIIDNGSQKNLISAEVVKILNFPTIPHPQPYTIGWLSRRRDISVIQQCRMSYGINLFKDDVVCDDSPLEVCDVILGKPYMWKHLAIYESLHRNVIVTMGGHLYRVPEDAPTTIASLISKKNVAK